MHRNLAAEGYGGRSDVSRGGRRKEQEYAGEGVYNGIGDDGEKDVRMRNEETLRRARAKSRISTTILIRERAGPGMSGVEMRE